MKIFKDEESSWSSKVNFVDDNDVFVGYDLSQCCCEDANWFIADKLMPYKYDESCQSLPDIDVSDYAFDREYFESVESQDLDGGGQVAFRLVSDGKPDLYLQIFNAHNGYYGHGFKVKHGGETVKEGYL